MLAVSQESAFGHELYFYMLAEVLTYLDKGLSLTGRPVDGMDKHGGGMFERLGPVSKELAVELLIILCSLCVAAVATNKHMRHSCNAVPSHSKIPPLRREFIFYAITKR